MMVRCAIRANTPSIAASHIRTLVTLFLANTELRKILADAGVVSRDLLSKATKKAAGTLAPHEDRLRQVDEPVRTEEEGTAGKFFSFDEQGRRHEVGTDQTPSLGGQIPLPGTERPDGHRDQARFHMDPRNDSKPGIQRDGDGGYHHVPYRKEEVKKTVEELKGKGKTLSKVSAYTSTRIEIAKFGGLFSGRDRWSI